MRTHFAAWVRGYLGSSSTSLRTANQVRSSPERKAVLDAIREELRKRDYLPVLFDFDKPATRDITETVRTLAHLSRFIIADLTDPSSIPQELQAVVPDLAVAVQPVLEIGKREHSMFVDFRKYPWVLPIHHYKDTNDLLASLGDKVIAPAEQKAKELEKRRAFDSPQNKKRDSSVLLATVISTHLYGSLAWKNAGTAKKDYSVA
jgi:hypothetical protein